MKKALALILALVMVLALAACGSSAPAANNDAPAANNDAPAADSGKTVKIGVLVSDVSGEEALGFRAYYENYIAKNYNVEFTYTEQLEDAAAEKAAIEKFAAQGYDAILSLAASDRTTQIETCEANGLYYAVVSGMLDDAQFEQFKSNEHFVGQIGPSMDTEFEAGYAMGKYFADQGAKTVGIYGAFIPNPMHVYRTAGVLAGLGCTYGGASDKDGIAGQLFGDQGVDMSKVECGDTQIIGYFQGFGDTTFDELFAIIGQKPDAFLSVGMATSPTATSTPSPPATLPIWRTAPSCTSPVSTPPALAPSLPPRSMPSTAIPSVTPRATPSPSARAIWSPPTARPLTTFSTATRATAPSSPRTCSTP